MHRACLKCFLRTFWISACFNNRGMQNVGLAFAMDPGITYLYDDPDQRRMARRRYLKHYNTNPYFIPLLVGIFLSLEREIAKGVLPAHTLTNVKTTTAYTLSAIGDSFFGGSLLVFWSLSTAILLLSGQTLAAGIWGAGLFVGLQAFKLGSFWLGLRYSLTFLQRMKSWDLLNVGRRIKCVNAVLLVVLWRLVWPIEPCGLCWVAGVAVISLIAGLISRTFVSRELILFLLTAIWFFAF